MNDSIKYIQILGLWGSGTNTLQNLCCANFSVQVGQNYLGKHGNGKVDWANIDKDKDHVLYLYIQKNIYAWVLSMRNNPHAVLPNRLDTSTAIRTRCLKYKNILHMREEVIKNVFEKVKHSVVHWEDIRHIDIVTQPKELIKRIANKYGLCCKEDISMLKYYKGTRDSCRFGDGKFNKRDYYIQQKYLSKISDNDFLYIKNNYDFSLENRSWINVHSTANWT